MISRGKSCMYKNSKDVAKMFGEILDNYESNERTIKYLREKNQELKNEAYKDSELASMKKELEKQCTKKILLPREVLFSKAADLLEISK